jgi:hypothetical protein
MQQKVRPRSITMTARVVRADGTVEELGVVARYERNPIKRLWNRLHGVGQVHLALKE